MKKKLLALFTALGMLLSMAAVLPAGFLDMMQASASMLYGPCGDNAEYCYDTETKTLTISGTGEMYSYTDSVLPWNGVEHVIIEEGITSVGNGAFKEQKRLLDIVLPSTVERIGAYSFMKSGIKQIICNSGLKTIAEYAFSYSDLHHIILNQGLENIYSYAFYCCMLEGTIDIPDTVAEIGASAFNLGNFEDAGENYPEYFNFSFSFNPPYSGSGYDIVYYFDYWREMDGTFYSQLEPTSFCARAVQKKQLPHVDFVINGDPIIQDDIGFAGINMIVSNSGLNVKPTFFPCSSFNLQDKKGRLSVTSGLSNYNYYTSPCAKYYTIYCNESSQAANLRNVEIIDYNLSHYTTSLKDVKYTGEKVVPDITLTHGTWTLKEGRDYTVECPDAVNAGKVDVTIHGMGKYTGSLSRSFYITKVALDECEFMYSPTEFEYNGKNQNPEITLKNPSGVVLKEDEDYTLEITDNKDVGKGTFTITGCGNYTGSITKEFDVNAKVITNDNLEIVLSTDTEPAVYTGNEIVPEIISVKDKDNNLILKKGTDYNVSYLNNVSAGTANVVIEGINNYSGIVYRPFSIGKVSIKDTEITVIPDSYYYDGTAKKPSVQVSYNSQLLSLGTDYSLSYENNTEIGTGVVTVTGKGNFDSFDTATFKIVEKPKTSIKSCDIYLDETSFAYDGTAHKPEVTVYNGVTLLKNDTDYEVNYSKNTNAGTALVIVSGIGEYVGSETREFTISKRSIRNTTAVLTPDSFYYDGNPKQPSVKVTDGETVLVSGVDYDVSFSSNTNIGSGIVTITGKGNYDSSFESYFNIVEKEHIYNDTIIPSTCTTQGYTIHICKLCGKTYEDSYVAPLGHIFETPTYSWSADNNYCTATRVCSRDHTHFETETVKAVTSIKTPATCTSKGTTRYTTTFSNKEFIQQVKDVENIAELGHSWNAPTYTWSDDYTSCTARIVCKNNSKHIETETVYSSSSVKTPATCTVKGTTRYTAKFSSMVFEQQIADIQNIPVVTHDFDDWTVTTKPTCTAKGVETRKCKNCEATETRDVDALGHKWSDWKTTSFDVNKGISTQTRTCSACNQTESKTTENAIQRLAGSGRYETAAKISQAAFDQADTVVLAYGLNYADALAGVSLAKSMNAPILLTNTKTLDATTLAEIKRLGAKNVIILGGTGAISDEVKKELENNGLTTERIAGASRFGTATAIAEKLTDAPTDVFFVYAFNSADALSVSPIAACKNAPIIYLSTNGDLHPDTAAYLAKLKKAGCVKNAYVIGGTGVISDDMMSKAAKALGLSKATRIAGANRFATCVEVNEKFADVLDGDMLCVATGMDFPDALAGGVYAAINKAPLFLINGKLKTPQLSDEQKAYLKKKAAAKITAFGGTGVVPDNHIADIAKNSI